METKHEFRIIISIDAIVVIFTRVGIWGRGYDEVKKPIGILFEDVTCIPMMYFMFTCAHLWLCPTKQIDKPVCVIKTPVRIQELIFRALVTKRIYDSVGNLNL